MTYDAIVIGARCAGSPTAMLLARRGWRVLLVDRATFPSDTLSAHYLHHGAVTSLRRWGLLDRVAASNCPPIYRFHTDLGGDLRFTVDYQKREFSFGRGSFPIPPPADGDGASYCPRRRILDAILLEAAASAGAEVREAFTVSELVVDGERVVGIRGKSEIRRRGGRARTDRGWRGWAPVAGREADGGTGVRCPPCIYVCVPFLLEWASGRRSRVLRKSRQVHQRYPNQ